MKNKGAQQNRAGGLKKTVGGQTNTGPFLFVFTVLALRAREGRDVPVKGATYLRSALRTAKGATCPRRALGTREGRYVPAKGATYPRRAL